MDAFDRLLGVAAFVLGVYGIWRIQINREVGGWLGRLQARERAVQHLRSRDPLALIAYALWTASALGASLICWLAGYLSASVSAPLWLSLPLMVAGQSGTLLVLLSWMHTGQHVQRARLARKQPRLARRSRRRSSRSA
jgi:hypothetical protein